MNRKIAWYATLLLFFGCAKVADESAIDEPSSEIIPVEEALSHLRDFLDLVSPFEKDSTIDANCSGIGSGNYVRYYRMVTYSL